MIDEEIRTIPLALESTVNGVTASIPWAQRQANGAVIVRVHLQSARHSAGELLLNETDLIALDADERPLRTQVRRFWGYSSLSDVTAAHLQTARFDIGFRLDMVATGGQCGLSIAIIRTFRPGEGPKALGGPWMFSFRVADEQELAGLARLEAARVEAAQREQAQREQAQREAAERDAAQREAARQARARAEAERGRVDAERSSQMRVERPSGPFEPRRDQAEPSWRTDGEDAGTAGRGRRLSRFGRPERGGRDEPRRDLPEIGQSTPEPVPAEGGQARPSEPTIVRQPERPAARQVEAAPPRQIEPVAPRQAEPAPSRQLEPVAPRQIELTPRRQFEPTPPRQTEPAVLRQEGAQPSQQPESAAPAEAALLPRAAEPRSRPSRAGSRSPSRVVGAVVNEPAESTQDAVGERLPQGAPPPLDTPVVSEPSPTLAVSEPTTEAETVSEKPGARARPARPATRRPSRARKPVDESSAGGEVTGEQAE